MSKSKDPSVGGSLSWVLRRDPFNWHLERIEEMSRFLHKRKSIFGSCRKIGGFVDGNVRDFCFIEARNFYIFITDVGCIFGALE